MRWTVMLVSCGAALLLSAFTEGGFRAAHATGTSPTYTTDCLCPDCSGEDRWTAKSETDEPPQSGIRSAKPSQIGAWHGPGGTFGDDTPRIPKEKAWYKVTGRVTLVKVQPDGDIHIQLVDEGAADDAVNVVVEVPKGEPWCAIRSTVFGWSSTQPPFRAPKDLTLITDPVITVVGKRFYDAHHRHGTTTSNRRTVPPNAHPTSEHVAVWEIHPVMSLTIKH